MSELIFGRRAVLETLRASRRRIYRLWLEGAPEQGDGSDRGARGDDRPDRKPADNSQDRNRQSRNKRDSGKRNPARGDRARGTEARGNESRGNDSRGDEARGTTVAEILTLAQAQNIPARWIEGGIFAKLAQQHQNAQGVALEVGDYPYVEPDAILAYAEARREPPFLLILDHLQDPQNMGTLFRTAEALGVHGVIIPERRSARISAAVSNAAAGAVEHLRIAQVTNINRVIDELKEVNIWSVGLDGASDTPEMDANMLAGPIALVVGSEGSGLSRLTRDTCDLLARLPMVGKIESLNAAVAGSIALYLAAQTRRQPQSG